MTEPLFPLGLPVPEALRELLQSAPELLDEQVSGSFAFRFESPETVAMYFGPSGNASAALAAQHLGVFGSGPDGSSLAVWRAPQGGMPVVYLCSEGGGRVLASDMQEFLRLLAVGYDEFSLHDDFTDPPAEDGEVAPALLQWLAERRLRVPPTGEAIVDAAEARWPDFSGWMEDAIDDRLKNAPAVAVQDPAAAAPVPDMPLWQQMQACLGEPIDAPIVTDLLGKLALKALKPGTPHNESTHASAKGIEISAAIDPKYRPLHPPRRVGRIWRTCIDRIILYPASARRVPLPEPLSWKSFPAAAGDAGRWLQHLGERCEILHFRDDDGLGTERIDLRLPQEMDFITADADYEKTKPLVYVEDAFFATWCALNGLLDTVRYSEQTLQPWRQRERTPLQLLHGPCGRLLWSSDLQPEFLGFMKRYYSGLEAPDSERWVSDVSTVFRTSNHFREEGESMTPDDWASYDRIAPFIRKRFDAWRLLK